MTTTFERAAPSHAGPHNFCRLTTLDQLDQWREAWRELAQNVASPIEQFIWTRTCATTLADPGTLCVAAATRAGQLAAIAPLVRKRLCGVSHRVLLGADLHEPMDVVSADEQSLLALADYLVCQGRPLVLPRVPADSPTIAALRKVCARRAVLVVRPQASCPFISLDEGWREPEQNLNSGRRSDLRRSRRRAEEHGPVSTQIITPRPGELDQLMDAALEIEFRSWKGDAGTALNCDLARAQFYRCYAQAAAREGILRLCFLQIGTQRVAMQVAVERGGGFWLLKVGYDNQFAQCSPGLLLMRDTIKYAAEAGLTSYEFLGKAEAWTDVWTKTERQHVSLRVYPLALRGLTALACTAVAAFFNRHVCRRRRGKS